MRLQEIATPDVISLEQSDSIDRAIVLMEEHDIRHLPVVDDGHPIGIISDRDLLSAVGWFSSHDRISSIEGPAIVGPTRVTQIMSSPVQALSPDDPIETAACLMLTENISCVPLVQNDCVVAIVTETDFLMFYLDVYLDDLVIAPGSGWRFQKVGEYMAAHLFSMKPTDTPSAALQLMQRKRIRHLPLLEENRLVGIVSDRDIRKSWFRDTIEKQDNLANQIRLMHRTTLRDIMSTTVETIGLSATLAEAADRMMTHRIGALPVIETRKPVGMITETDLLRAFLAACEGSRLIR